MEWKAGVRKVWALTSNITANTKFRFEILDEAEEPHDGKGAIDLTEVSGTVEFQNVSFSFTPGIKVLKDVSFSVNPGEVVALVGETGAGKTTIGDTFYSLSLQDLVLLPQMYLLCLFLSS